MNVTAKVNSVKRAESSVVVVVGFYSNETDELLGDKTYYLDAGQTIDDLKPRIKDHIAEFDNAEKTKEALKLVVGTAVDLTDVESVKEKEAREAQAKADAQAEAEAQALDNKE